MDIAAWLRSLNLDRYAQAFRDNDVTAEILPHLTAEDLKDLGVTSIGHRRKLLQAIAAIDSREKPPAQELEPAAQSTHIAPSTETRAGAHAGRRQLTVLFCDLVGSTALAGELDPEDMRDVMRAYQDCCAGMIARFEGHVARFMGDGVLAYFGYPVAHENDAERAVRAALDLMPAIAGLPLRNSAALRLRIGIATGTVVVGDLIGKGASQEEAVIGETPALAARLQAIAQPDEVLISARTRLLIGGLFECADAGRLDLKGFAEPVQAWRVVGEGEAEDRFEAMRATILTGMVGREREIELLFDRWTLAAGGEGQVVLLCGEPGIGKSRITQALRERIAGEPHTRLHHSCSPHHQNSALMPIIAQIEHAAGFHRGDSPDARIEKLKALLSTASTDLDEIVPLFAALLGLPGERPTAWRSSAEEQKSRTLRALVAQLEGLASRQSLLVIFEDVQWIDPTTSELLGLIIDRIQTLPVLLIIAHRPDFVPPWMGHAHMTTLSLNRLSQAQSAAMVERVTSGKRLPPEVRDQIIAKTDGIPLFIEELTRTVLESGVLEDRGEHYALQGPLPPLAIPATLHDSLMARLDRLSPVKEVAQIAAAIGREFAYDLLAAISPMGESDLQQALGQLAAAKLIFARGTPPNAVYTFKHALVQDVAYEASLRSTRHQLHAQIARTLEEKFPETALNRPELVAHHYTAANMPSEASAYWYKAGQLAIGRSANIEASNHFRKGLELLASVPAAPERNRRELDLQIAIGPPLIALKGFGADETVRVYRRVRELSEQLGNVATMFPALYGEWLYHAARAEHRTAQSIAMLFLELADTHKDSGLTVIAHRISGVAYLCLGELARSRAHLEALLSHHDPEAHSDLARRYGTDPAVSGASFLSWVLWLQGETQRAIDMRTKAIERAGDLRHSHSLAHALGIGGCLFDCMRGDAESAREVADRTIELGREHRFPYWLAAGTAARGWCLTRQGKFGQAVATLLDAIDQARGATMKEFRPLLLSMLAEAYAGSNRHDLGLTALDEAIARANKTEERWIEPELHRLRGELLLRGDRFDRRAAEACFRQALNLARQQGARAWELRAAASLAALPRPLDQSPPRADANAALGPAQ